MSPAYDITEEEVDFIVRKVGNLIEDFFASSQLSAGLPSASRLTDAGSMGGLPMRTRREEVLPPCTCKAGSNTL